MTHCGTCGAHGRWEGACPMCESRKTGMMAVAPDGTLAVWDGHGWVPGANVLRNAAREIVLTGVTTQAGCAVAGNAVQSLRTVWAAVQFWVDRKLDALEAGSHQPPVGEWVRELVRGSLLPFLSGPTSQAPPAPGSTPTAGGHFDPDPGDCGRLPGQATS